MTPTSLSSTMNTLLHRLRHMCHLAKHDILGHIHARNPRRRANAMFRAAYGRDIDFAHPVHFIEKLRWIQFNTGQDIRTRLADKLSAREYVREKGLEQILIPLLGVWNSPEEIDYDSMPQAFVMKTTHGSGDAVIVRNRNTADRRAIASHFHEHLSRTYGRYYAENHYAGIPHRLMAEALLPNDSTVSESIVDYKFYCCDGTPEMCLVCSNRRDIGAHDIDRSAYDMTWTCRNEWLTPDVTTNPRPIPRPAEFNLMKEICATLAEGLPFVSIDLYHAGGKVYFGEFTFSPNAYQPVPFTEEAFAMLASHITVPPVQTTDAP